MSSPSSLVSGGADEGGVGGASTADGHIDRYLTYEGSCDSCTILPRNEQAQVSSGHCFQRNDWPQRRVVARHNSVSATGSFRHSVMRPVVMMRDGWCRRTVARKGVLSAVNDRVLATEFRVYFMQGPSPWTEA